MTDFFKLEIAKIVYSHFQNCILSFPKKLPLLLSNRFFKINTFQQKQLDHLIQQKVLFFYISKFRSSRLRRSIMYQGVKIRNEIPFE